MGTTAPDIALDLLDVDDVAKRLNVSPGWVRDHAVGRRLPKIQCVRLGCLIRFRPADVEAFITEQSHSRPWRKRRG
jgi:Helix-turn-helix domain